MLDAYIIDRIRRERQERTSMQVPLHIEVPDNEETDPLGVPLPVRRPEPQVDDSEDDSGIIIIDNRVF